MILTMFPIGRERVQPRQPRLCIRSAAQDSGKFVFFSVGEKRAGAATRGDSLEIPGSRVRSRAAVYPAHVWRTRGTRRRSSRLLRFVDLSLGRQSGVSEGLLLLLLLMLLLLGSLETVRGELRRERDILMRPSRERGGVGMGCGALSGGHGVRYKTGRGGWIESRIVGVRVIHVSIVRNLCTLGETSDF